MVSGLALSRFGCNVDGLLLGAKEEAMSPVLSEFLLATAIIILGPIVLVAFWDYIGKWTST
jgi:hypothetical protein